MVGQSGMCATIIVSFLGGPLHLWGALLGEGSPSLNPHLTYWMVHQSFNIQMMGHQWWLVYISYPCFSRLSCLSCRTVLVMLCSCFCAMCVVWIYCDLWSVLKNFCVMRIFYVECLIDGNMCLSFSGTMCFCVCICDMTWSHSFVNYSNCDSCIYDWEWNLDLLNLCLSQWLCWDVDLSWHLALEWVFLCLAGVPDGGILSGQSAVTWPYSSQSKHFMQGQWHAICPNSWHWKHFSSSLDMTFTEGEGSRVAVNCCAA